MSQARGPEDLARTRALLRAALEDFAACQGPSHAFYAGPDNPFLSCRNSGRLSVCSFRLIRVVCPHGVLQSVADLASQSLCV